MMRAIRSGQPLGWSMAQLRSRVQMAADKGDVDALALVAEIKKAGRWPARGSRGITASLLKTWCCPTCFAAARSASGTNGTVTCVRGHARAANPEERSPFLRKLLGRQ